MAECEVASELTPLKVFTTYVTPRAADVWRFLNDVTVVPNWTFAAVVIGSALGTWAAVAARTRWRSKRRVVVDGITFSVGYHHEIACPVCTRCSAELIPSTEMEERRDRNNIPFVFRPEQDNVLCCQACSIQVKLLRPLPELVSEALASGLVRDTSRA